MAQATTETAAAKRPVVESSRIRDELLAKLERELESEARDRHGEHDGAQMFTDV